MVQPTRSERPLNQLALGALLVERYQFQAVMGQPVRTRTTPSPTTQPHSSMSRSWVTSRLSTTPVATRRRKQKRGRPTVGLTSGCLAKRLSSTNTSSPSKYWRTLKTTAQTSTTLARVCRRAAQCSDTRERRGRLVSGTPASTRSSQIALSHPRARRPRRGCAQPRLCLACCPSTTCWWASCSSPASSINATWSAPRNSEKLLRGSRFVWLSTLSISSSSL